MLRTRLGYLIAVAAPILLATPQTSRAQSEGITWVDFVGTHFIGLTNAGTFRRGVTSTVTIVKNFIDLVPDGQINLSGGGSLSPITHGRTAAGEGFISMKVTVSSTQAVGSTITINVGLVDHFPFSVTHTGLISGITPQPNPTTIVGGTHFKLIVSGTDLATMVATQSCHTSTTAASSATSVTLDMVRNTACASNVGPFTFGLVSTTAGDPGTYAKSDGTKSFSFGPYQPNPPPTTTVICTTANVGTPVITSPPNNETIEFAATSSATQNVTIAWDRNTQPGNVPAPNNVWLVTYPTQFNKQGQTLTTVTDSVTGNSKTIPFHVPGTYSVSVKAKNCGTPGPSSSVRFSFAFP
jgi:hypothetical protein